jgi:hypothetical protein
MESKSKLVALVKSPSKDAHIRECQGFSLKEIKEAGKTIDLLKKSKVKIDYFRKSAYPENIKILKTIESPPKSKKKREAFIKKEKKRTQFITIEDRRKSKQKKTVKAKPKKAPAKSAVKKEKVKPKKKEKVIAPKVEKVEKVPIKATGIALTDLSGLGATTAKKFIELGVDSVEALCEENPEELASLIKGVSLERLRKWIDEGKELIQ